MSASSLLMASCLDRITSRSLMPPPSSVGMLSIGTIGTTPMGLGSVASVVQSRLPELLRRLSR
jgi:hypothetical protein